MSEKWKSRILTGAFWALILAAVWAFSEGLLADGLLSWHRKQREYYRMLAETVLLFGLFSVIFGIWRRRISKWPALLLAGTVLGIFLWGHGVFLPVLVAGIYVGYLILAGRFVASKLPQIRGPVASFLTGCLAVICVFCLMSAFGVGNITNLKYFVLLTGAGLFIYYGVAGFRAGNWRKPFLRQTHVSWYSVLLFSFILTMFCIQAGRMNIAVDHDSLWYGLRSPYILNNGGGIYENLGTIGIVYTYSKGFEILTLPLSDLPSYSFLLSFNLWLTAGVLWLSYRVGKMLTGDSPALLLTAMLAAVPGIMNMGITAKSDTATLFFQIFLLYCGLCYVREEDHPISYLGMGAAAFFLTWTMKPTALVFSTAVAGMSLIFFLCKRIWPSCLVKRELAGSILLTAFSLVVLFAVWARTLLITGLPVTSVFSSLLTKLGFGMKYPFEISKIPNNSADLSFMDGLSAFGQRLFRFLICPVGTDMGHVILAWGGFLLFFFLVAGTVCLFMKKREEAEGGRLVTCYMGTVFLPFLLVNLISLSMLGQVDGNYFMLLYVLSGFYVFPYLWRVEDSFVRRGIGAAAAGSLCFLALVTSLTSWSWALGYTPVSFRHKGYYDHLEARRLEMTAEGNGTIWETLAEDPKTRVIAIGKHPQVLSFPCNVQSYDDITGYWGNVVLVKTMDRFVEFMTYAKTDYVYIQSGYMGTEERCYSLVRTLIEYGKLEPVLYEEGGVLTAVLTDGEQSEASVSALSEFDRCYRTKKE